MKTSSLVALLIMCACTSPHKNIKVYTADHKSSSLQRLQDGDVIPTTDPVFSKMLCLDGEAFWRLAQLAEKCN